MSPKSKKSKNNIKQNEEDNFLIHEQNNNHIDSDSEAKNREMSINSELFYSMNNRSVEPLDRTPSIGASVGRGFSIVNANSNPPSNTVNLSKRRQSFNKTKAMKAGSGHGNADLNSQNTVIRRPSENLEPFQFKHPFGGQPNTIIKNSGNTVKNGKKDVLMPPRSNSITSLLGAAAMMNSDSKRNSLVNFNMNDLDKLNNNSGSNNVGTMKPPKKLPVTQKQQNNSNEMMEIHKAPSMSEFDFFGGNGRKDSFKAPSFIPQSLNDLDSDIFLNRKNSNIRGSMVLDNNSGRYSRTFSSGMQQFLNQNFGNQNGLSSDINNNNNSNIPKRNEGNQNQRHRTSSVGASQFADFIKGNENAISDDEDDDHHPLHRSGHHQTSDVRGQRSGNSDYEGKDDGMTTDDMIQLAHAAALAGGVPLSQQQHKQSFRNSFIGNGVNLQSLLQQDPTLSGNFNGRGRRSIRANSNTPMPMGTPPLHAFGNSFSMMNNMGLNVAITSDEEDHNHSHHSNDFDLFNQTGGLRDSFISGLSGQAAFSNSSSSTKSTKGKKKTTKKTATAMKKKNSKAVSDPAVSEAKKQNKVVADAAFEAAAHASSLATINKQEKESFATQRRGKKLEKSKKMKMNNIMNSSMVTATPTTRTSKRKATQTSGTTEPNIINENKRFMGQGVISEFNTNNKKSENTKSMKSFGKIMKPSDFLTTTLNTSMEPTSKNSGNKKTAGVKRKLPAAESSKKKAVAKGKGSDEDVLKNGRTQDEVEAAAALQIIAKSESPIPPSGRKESSSEFEHTKFNRKDSMVQGVDTHLIHNDEVDQMDIDMKNQLMNASYEGYGDDEYEYNNNYQDDGSESEDDEEDDEAMDYNEVEASEDEMDFENESEESSKPVPEKNTSEKAKPKRSSRTATKKAASTEAKKVTRTRAPPVVRKPPVLLAEPIRVANPIIPQIKSENDDSNRYSLGEGEGSSAESSIKPEGSQPKSNNNDNVAVLGATNVDQLMLILQARQKGFQKHIKKTSDGKLDIFSNPDIIPPAVELVGGVDKPKVNDDGQHFSHGKDDDHEHRSPSAEGSINANNRKMYVCKYCKKQFSQTTHLEVHVRSHVGLKPYTCEHCGKSFTQGGNLRTHIRLHTGEQPFKCDICSKRFSRKGNLQAHMLTHDKSKPFPCKLDDCEKSFTQLGNLKSHQNKFHSTTLNNLTLKLAEGLTGNESQEELEALDYLGSLYKNSNRGIKGRGKKQVPTAQT